MNFVNNPQYQRLALKLRTMSPDQRAVLSAAGFAGQFAADEARKKTASMGLADRINLAEQRLASSDKNAQRDYSLGLKRLGLAKDASDYNYNQDLLSAGVAAAGGGLNSYLGYRNMQNQNDMTRMILDEAAARRKRLGEV